MKKNVVLLLTLLLIQFAFSQETLKDTVYLDNVSVGKSNKHKYINYNISGHPAYGGIDNQTSKLVCLLDNLPKGKIENVTFYLNTGLPNLLKRKLKINYKDILLGIFVCEVDDKGKPGKIISDNDIKFLVSKDHKGALTVDLKSLKLNSQKMYFGINVLSDLSKSGRNIYIRFCEDENAKMYHYSKTYNSDTKHWYMYHKYNFKLKMKIRQ